MADLVGQQVGNYHVIRLISDEGGFGDVYLGKHIELGTQVAIKVLKASLASNDISKFRSEAIIIAKLNHPNIVRVFDYGVRGNTPYMVMDYAPHGTLRDRHSYGSVLPLTTILSYVKQVASALQYAHDQKIIHRDVKPENMLLDANKNILVSDFGIAVAAHRTRSLPTQDKFGTIYYMAPEHIQGKPRPASDQYSLAIVVYEWLCGTFPFDGLSDIEIAMKHLSQPPPSFEKHLNIPLQVKQVVIKALAKDPNNRYPSVQAFSDALDQASIQAAKVVVKPAPQPIQPITPIVPQPVTPQPQPKPIISPQPHKTPRPHISRRKLLIGTGAIGLGLAGVTVLSANLGNIIRATTQGTQTELYRVVAQTSDFTMGTWKGTPDWKSLNGNEIVSDGSNPLSPEAVREPSLLIPYVIQNTQNYSVNWNINAASLQFRGMLGFFIDYSPDNKNGYIIWVSADSNSGTGGIGISQAQEGFKSTDKSDNSIIASLEGGSNYGNFRIEVKDNTITMLIDGNQASLYTVPRQNPQASSVGLFDTGIPLGINMIEIDTL